LEAGAVVKGSEDVNDYRAGNRTYSLIRATDARNIAIIGRGIIDGSGTAFMDMDKTRVGDYMPKDLD
jgi:polygalacturonase